LALLALPLAACAPEEVTPQPAPPPEKVFKWRAQTYAVSGTVGFETTKAALDHLREMTNGRLDITLYPIGALVGYSEMLEALGEGVYEVGFNASAFFSGYDPAFTVIWNLPGIWDNPRQAHIWFSGYGGDDFYRELYANYNIHYLGVQVIGAEPIMSKKPLRTLEDFNGLKVRAAPGMSHELLAKVGAVPVPLPGGEIYTALDTGLIDACEFVTVTENYGLGLHEVTDYILWPSFHGPTANCDLSVNMDAWNSLPDDLKACLEAAAVINAKYYDYWPAAADHESLAKMTDYGLEHCVLSAADMAKVRAMGVEIAKEWKAKSPMCDAIITSVIDYLTVTGQLE